MLNTDSLERESWRVMEVLNVLQLSIIVCRFGVWSL